MQWRFSLIASLFLVLKEGKSIEEGTYEDLMNLLVRYRYLYDLQNAVS